MLETSPLIAHLAALRRCVFICLITLTCFTIFCWFFADFLFSVLTMPLAKATGAQTASLVYTAPHEYFFTQLKVALFFGALLAFPVLATQVYRFVTPGLFAHEKRFFRAALLASSLLFLVGLLFVYFLLLPMALHFFWSMGGPSLSMQGLAHLFSYIGVATPQVHADVTMLPKVGEYFSFAATLLLSFGFCFQLPVFLVLAHKGGLVSLEALCKNRRIMIVAAFAIAAVLTPPDLLSQVMLGVPLVLLYESAIVYIRLFAKSKIRVEKCA